MSFTGHATSPTPSVIAESPPSLPIDIFDTQKIHGRELVVCCARDVVSEKVEWLWPGRIALGKLTLIGGPPGLGKSQITTFLAATVSNGGTWPCGEGNAPMGSSILLSAEDGIGDTIVPRLAAAGADMSRVYVIAAVVPRAGVRRQMFNLKADLDLLEEKIKKVGDVRLIVIDPVSAYMGGADGNGNVETREILEPLSDLASRVGAAVVAVTHLNKGGGATKQSALNRFVGSIAFAAAARAAFMVAKDADDQDNRLFLHAKNNLGTTCEGLSFRLQQRTIDGGIVASSIVWGSEYISATADEALAAAEGPPGNTSEKNDAMEFLQTVLAEGPMLVSEVQQNAIQAGLLQGGQLISQSKPFRSARKALRITTHKDSGFGGAWILALPTESKMPMELQRAPPLIEGTSQTAGMLLLSQAKPVP
jgi:putative DNA primase/helicase